MPLSGLCLLLALAGLLAELKAEISGLLAGLDGDALLDSFVFAGGPDMTLDEISQVGELVTESDYWQGELVLHFLY